MVKFSVIKAKIKVIVISGSLGLQRLEQDFGSRPETEVRAVQWEHWILTTRRLGTSGQSPGPGLQLCRKEFPQRQKIVKQVKCLLGGNIICVDRQTGRLRESHALVIAWITYMGHFFQVSFGQSFCFAWFRVHSCYISGCSPVCVRIS